VPVVDYRCEDCGATVEVFATSPVAGTVACASCEGVARRQYGLGGLLGVRPAKRAKERLDYERANRTPMGPAARQRLHEHLQGHDHDHHDHDHHDHDHGHVTTTEEEK
jgi:hypothetical protein